MMTTAEEKPFLKKGLIYACTRFLLDSARSSFIYYVTDARGLRREGHDMHFGGWAQQDWQRLSCKPSSTMEEGERNLLKGECQS